MKVTLETAEWIFESVYGAYPQMAEGLLFREIRVLSAHYGGIDKLVAMCEKWNGEAGISSLYKNPYHFED